MRVISIAILVAIVACGPSRAPEAQAGSSSSPSTEPAPTEPAPTPPPPMPTPPTPALMQELARDESALAEHVDPARGVIRVEIFSDASGTDRRAGPDGVVRISERLCGEAIDAYLVELKRDLALRVSQTSHDPLFTCTSDACSFPAELEFDRRGVLRFAHHPQRGVLLDAVVRIEGAGPTEAWTREAEAWANEQLRRLASTSCPS